MLQLRARVGLSEMEHTISGLHGRISLNEAEIISHEAYIGVGIRFGLLQLEDVLDILYFAHFKINYKPPQNENCPSDRLDHSV